MMLFTGDEMGYMNKWDVRALVEKMNELSPPKPIDGEMTKEQ